MPNPQHPSFGSDDAPGRVHGPPPPPSGSPVHWHTDRARWESLDGQHWDWGTQSWVSNYSPDQDKAPHYVTPRRVFPQPTTPGLPGERWNHRTKEWEVVWRETGTEDESTPARIAASVAIWLLVLVLVAGVTMLVVAGPSLLGR